MKQFSFTVFSCVRCQSLRHHLDLHALEYIGHAVQRRLWTATTLTAGKKGGADKTTLQSRLRNIQREPVARRVSEKLTFRPAPPRKNLFSELDGCTPSSPLIRQTRRGLLPEGGGRMEEI